MLAADAPGLVAGEELDRRPLPGSFSGLFHAFNVVRSTP
jgi:hypothetical protein